MITFLNFNLLWYFCTFPIEKFYVSRVCKMVSGLGGSARNPNGMSYQHYSLSPVLSPPRINLCVFWTYPSHLFGTLSLHLLVAFVLSLIHDRSWLMVWVVFLWQWTVSRVCNGVLKMLSTSNFDTFFIFYQMINVKV